MKEPSIKQLEADPDHYNYLLKRVGAAHVRQRLGVEAAHASARLGQGRTLLHIENSRLIRTTLRLLLKSTGLWQRGQKNVLDFQLRQQHWPLPHLPSRFDGFTLLQLSDLHLDSMDAFAPRLAERIGDIKYDACLLTGDYRFLTFGSHEPAMAGLEQLCKVIHTDVFAILGNHDTLMMVPAMEAMGIRMLLNENTLISRGDDSIYLAGVDDPHYFGVDNLEKSYQGIPDNAVSILLSHSPEIYRHAAYVGFDLMLCGHTHGGQICLPGGYALTYNASAPRFTGAGVWHFDQMQAYTSVGTGSSVVPARFNCPPEITLHVLKHRAP